MKRDLSVFSVGVLALALAGFTVTAAQHSHGGTTPDMQAQGRGSTPTYPDRTLKVGKKGEVTFDTETYVGGATLEAGKYRLQHRATGSDHFIAFTQQLRSGPTVEVRCELEPIRHKVSRTFVRLRNTGTSIQLVRVEIAGENVAHVFYYKSGCRWLTTFTDVGAPNRHRRPRQPVEEIRYSC